MWQWRAAKCQPGETTNLWGDYKGLVMGLQRFGNEATKPLVSYGLGLNCSLSGSGVLLVYGKAFTKTNKTPYCGQNPSGFNKRYGVWSYESKLSTPIRHTFYWCSKLHLAHNRAINIKNIWLATTNNIGCYSCLRASGCFLCLSPYIFSEWHIVPLLYI